MVRQSFFKNIFTGILFLLFLYLFGIPAIEKFTRRSVFIRKETRKHDFQLPVLTVCSSNEVGSGWKKSNYRSLKNTLENVCNTSKTFRKMIKCVNDRTYSLEETVSMKLKHTTPPFNESSWTEDVTLTFFGRCHTLIPRTSREAGMRIFLKRKNNSGERHGHRIFLHTTDYFVMNVYPTVVPRATILIDGPGNMQVLISVKDRKR